MGFDVLQIPLSGSTEIEALLTMIKPQSPVDVAVEMLRDLEEFNRSGSKEAFRKELREEFVRRSGAASLDEALATAMTSLVPLLRQTLGKSSPIE